MIKTLLALLILSTTLHAPAQDKTSLELIGSTGNYNAQLTADFNRDGKPDLASGIGVNLGNGDGTFQDTLYFPTTPNGLSDLSAVDVDGDGRLDVIGIASQNDGAGNIVSYVAVFFGNGDGTFQAGASIFPPSRATINTIAVADFSGDKLQDIAVGEADGLIQIYKNVGSRNFVPATSVYISDSIDRIRAGDFDGDSKVDLAVQGTNSAYVLWGDGTTNFSTTLLKTYSGISGLTISVGDVNLDARPDILVGINCGLAPPVGRQGSVCLTIDVFYGGQGPHKTSYRNLASNLVYQVGTLATVDVNGDGIGDIVASGRDNSGILSGIFFFLGHPDGTIDQVPQRFISNSDSVGGIVLGDFNRDGMMDFISPLAGSAATQIYLNSTKKPACSTSKVSGTVIVCAPANGSYIPSPIPLQATTFDTTPISYLQEYIDNQLTYSKTSGDFFISQSVKPGTHHFVTKAVDKKGSSFYSDRYLTIYSGTPGSVCSTPASAAIICLPSAPTAHSPLHILANANTSNVPTAVQLYLDGKLLINDNRGGTTAIDTTQSLAKGTHSLVFKLYDDTGKVTSTSKQITVE